MLLAWADYVLRFYQRSLSPLFHAFTGVQFGCRFEPTCSQFMRESLQRYGLLRGLRLGCNRILRCNPFSRAGFDPVPPCAHAAHER